MLDVCVCIDLCMLMYAYVSCLVHNSCAAPFQQCKFSAYFLLHVQNQAINRSVKEEPSNVRPITAAVCERLQG